MNITMQHRWIPRLAIGLFTACVFYGCQAQTPTLTVVPSDTPGAQITQPTQTSPAPVTADTPQTVQTPTRVLTVEETLQPQSISTQEKPAMNVVPISTPFDAAVEAQVKQARDDLARQLSIDASQIELVDAASVTWPDASLGCPKPGMAYAQVTVEGIRIRFRAGGQVYEYHGGANRAPFLCK